MRKNKIISMLVSLAIAFGLWLYVVTFVSSELTETIYNIPVAFQGETALSERNLMITDIASDTVDLTLTGSRSELAKVNRNNLVVKVDLTKILDPGVHQLEYDTIYPGDVSNNAFSEDSRYPSFIAVTVEKKLTKNVPVEITRDGAVPEGYLVDMENAVLDYNFIEVVGPSSVVELIDHAKIEVDLEGCTESISESYRYILCDADDNPVNVELVTTNTAEVHLDLKIQRFEEIQFVLDVIYGGGAQSHTTRITMEPETIKVSGSETLLEDLKEYVLGTIDLSTIMENTTLTYPITLPEGVTNLSGIEEVTVSVEFVGLSVKEFTVDQIQVTNVPAGLEYELLNQAIKLSLRGDTALINSIRPEDILVVVDLSGKEIGTSTVKASITVQGNKYQYVGAVGSYSVSVTLKEAEAG